MGNNQYIHISIIIAIIFVKHATASTLAKSEITYLGLFHIVELVLLVLF